jgi:MFS transporter, DHA1 family, solute carrier family 18 (vesicular amine transporter), member 1/2
MSPPTRATSTLALAVACLALFADMLVYGLAIPVLPLLPSVVAAGPTATGALFAAYAAASLLATGPAGWLVDRTGPRGPLLGALLTLAASTVLFALGGAYPLLLLARTLQGLAAGLGWVAGLSLIAATTPEQTRGRAMGLAMSMVSVGLLAGPPVAGLLVERISVRAPFEFATGLAVLIILAVLVLPTRLGDQPGEPGGMRGVLAVRGSWPTLGAVVLGAAAVAAVEPVLPLHLTQAFGMDALTLGLLFAVMVVASAALSPVAGALTGRVDARLLTLAGVLATVAGLVLFGLATQPWHVWLASVLLGAGEGAMLAPATTLIAVLGGLARPAALGAAYALFMLAYSVGMVIGPLLAGAGTGRFGIAATLTGLGALTLLSSAASLPRMPGGLDHPAPEELPERTG